MREEVVCYCGRRERQESSALCEHEAGRHENCHPDDCGHSALGYTRLLMVLEGSISTE